MLILRMPDLARLESRTFGAPGLRGFADQSGALGSRIVELSPGFRSPSPKRLKLQTLSGHMLTSDYSSTLAAHLRSRNGPSL